MASSEEKTVFLIGGLAIAAIVVFAVVKNAQNTASLATNEPGLEGQPATPGTASTILGSLLSGAAVGGLGSIGTGIAGLFSGGSSSGGGVVSSSTDNDPGLDTTDDLDYDGTDDYDDLTDDNSFDEDDSGVESLTDDD
jgi:hypothetical protein